MCCILSGLLHVLLSRENKRRDALYGPPPSSDDAHEWDDPETLRSWGLENLTSEEVIALGDDHPAFRFYT